MSAGVVDPSIWVQPAVSGIDAVSVVSAEVADQVETRWSLAIEALAELPVASELALAAMLVVPLEWAEVDMPLEDLLAPEALDAVHAVIEAWDAVVPVIAEAHGSEEMDPPPAAPPRDTGAAANPAVVVGAAPDAGSAPGGVTPDRLGALASGSDSDEPAPAPAPPGAGRRQQLISEFGAGVEPVLDDTGEAGVTVDGLWMPRPADQLGQQGHMVLPKKLGHLRVAQLNVRGCFGQRDFCGHRG